MYHKDDLTKGGINLYEYCRKILYFCFVFISESLGKIINFFKKALQTSKIDVRPLEVAKECIGPNATKSCINRYLHCLERAKVLSMTYHKITKDSKSDPRWNALPDIKDITGI